MSEAEPTTTGSEAPASSQIAVAVALRRLSGGRTLHLACQSAGVYRLPLLPWSTVGDASWQVNMDVSGGTNRLEAVVYVPFGRLSGPPSNTNQDRLHHVVVPAGQWASLSLTINLDELCKYLSFSSAIVVQEIPGPGRIEVFLGNGHPGFLRTPTVLDLSKQKIRLGVSNRLHPNNPVDLVIQGAESAEVDRAKTGANAWRLCGSDGSLDGARIYLIDRHTGYAERILSTEELTMPEKPGQEHRT